MDPIDHTQLTKAEQEMLEIIQHAVATFPMTIEEAHERLGLDPRRSTLERLKQARAAADRIEDAVVPLDPLAATRRLASTSEVVADPDATFGS